MTGTGLKNKKIEIFGIMKPLEKIIFFLQETG